MTSPESPLHPSIPWLAGEQFDIALDATDGALDSPPQRGDALVLTTHRIIRFAESASERALALLPLSSVAAVEIVDISRPAQRLGTGLFLLVVSALLGLISWSMFAIPFVSLLLGGIPALISVYALAGWAFPDGEGALRIYTHGHAFTQPLRSPAARRDAYLIAQHLSAPPHADPQPSRRATAAEQRSPHDARPRPAHDHASGAQSRPPHDDNASEQQPPHDHASGPQPQAPSPDAAPQRRPRVPLRRRPLSPLRERHKLPRPSSTATDTTPQSDEKTARRLRSRPRLPLLRKPKRAAAPRTPRSIRLTPPNAQSRHSHDDNADEQQPPHDHASDPQPQPPSPGAAPQRRPRVPLRRRPLSPLRERHKLPRPSSTATETTPQSAEETARPLRSRSRLPLLKKPKRAAAPRAPRKAG